MNLAEAIAYAQAVGRATSDTLPTGTVIKTEDVGEPPKPQVRVIWEATGAGHMFTPNADHEAAEWRKVEGWGSYG